MKRRDLLRYGLSLPLVGAALPAMAQSPAPITVRYAAIGGTTDAPLYIGEDYGLFKAAGIDFRYQRLDSAAALLAAIATKALDVAGISLTPGLFTAIQQGINLRVVGDKESILKDFAATQFVVRKALATGSEAEIFRRLKGRPVAVSGKTSASYFLLCALLKKYGLAPGDVRVIELVYANMLPAFVNGAIDAAIELEPFLSQAVASGGVTPVSNLVEIVPAVGASIVPLVYSEDFAANRAAGENFLLAYTKAVRIYLDAFIKGVDKERIVALIARRTNFDPKIIRDSNPVGFDPDQRVSTAFLEQVQQFYLDQKMIRAPSAVTTLVDPSFAQAAVRTLGPYK